MKRSFLNLSYRHKRRLINNMSGIGNVAKQAPTSFQSQVDSFSAGTTVHEIEPSDAVSEAFSGSIFNSEGNCLSENTLNICEKSIANEGTSNLLTAESLENVNTTLSDDYIEKNSITPENISYSPFSEATKTYDAFLNDEHNELVNLRNLLRLWAVDFHISQSAMNKLLEILRNIKILSDLPKDSRTLMKTPRSINEIVELAGGKFIHFGVEKNIKRSIKKYYKKIPKDVKININVDGLPLCNSSGSQFWPILGCIVDSFYTQPFIISIFHGFHKPSCANELLKYFVDEFQILENSGICINDQIVKISLNAVICDAPAKALVTGVKEHGGYFACSKCITEGDFIDNRMTYTEIKCDLRTDLTFKLRSQPEFHKFTSYLERLNIGMVSQVPNDPMHLVYLGVTKKLIRFWVLGPVNLRLKKNDLQRIDEHLNIIKPCITQEFARKPRSILDIKYWKASELRQFLLYTGPIVMKDILDVDYYDHFLSLSIAIRILSNEEFHIMVGDNAHCLLEWFVTKFSELYGEKYVSYNVHNLIHLRNDVKEFGSLDTFSSFRFENYMQTIKNKLKLSNNPLQQIHNRLAEEHMIPVECLEKKYPIIKYSSDSVKEIIFKDFSLTCLPFNNCFQHVNGKLYEICNILNQDGNVIVLAKQFVDYDCFFDHPVNSKHLSIFLVTSPRNEIVKLKIAEIKRKCLKLIVNSNQFALVPLIHSDTS